MQAIGTLAAEGPAASMQHVSHTIDKVIEEIDKDYYNEIFGCFGRSFEKWVGILLNMEGLKRLENSTIIPYSQEGKMEVDYLARGVNGRNFITLLEVKSSTKPLKRKQFGNYISTGLPVTYIVTNPEIKDKLTGSIEKSLRARKREDRKAVTKVICPQDLESYNRVSHTKMAELMEKRRSFLLYFEIIEERKNDVNLDKDLDSIYQSIKYNGANVESITTALDAAYYNDSELKREAELFGYQWDKV